MSIECLAGNYLNRFVLVLVLVLVIEFPFVFEDEDENEDEEDSKTRVSGQTLLNDDQNIKSPPHRQAGAT